MNSKSYLAAVAATLGQEPASNDGLIAEWPALRCAHGPLAVSVSLNNGSIHMHLPESTIPARRVLGVSLHSGKWNIIADFFGGDMVRMLAELQRRLGLAGYMPPASRLPGWIETRPKEGRTARVPWDVESLTAAFGEGAEVSFMTPGGAVKTLAKLGHGEFAFMHPGATDRLVSFISDDAETAIARALKAWPDAVWTVTPAEGKPGLPFDKAKSLHDQAMDTVGVIREWLAMPVKSLSDKFSKTALRLELRAREFRDSVGATRNGFATDWEQPAPGLKTTALRVLVDFVAEYMRPSGSGKTHTFDETQLQDARAELEALEARGGGEAGLTFTEDQKNSLIALIDEKNEQLRAYNETMGGGVGGMARRQLIEDLESIKATLEP